MRRIVLVTASAALALTLFGGSAASAPAKTQLTTITVDTLPIANALPMDLGIQKGFFAAQGIEIKKTVLQSGNDIVLALSNHNGDVGYLGYVPMMIARTQGIRLALTAASEVEGTSEADNWQNIMVKGSSSIRTAPDLAGKTIAVNALKGVGEVMIRAALKKIGVDPNSIKLLAMPFPTMRSALSNGQVDAIWTPEPFVAGAQDRQRPDRDGAGAGARKVLAERRLRVADELAEEQPCALAKSFRTAINKSLSYAQAHPDEIRALLPAATQNVRLPIWSPLVDRDKLLQLAKYAKEFGVITSLPNFTKLVPSAVSGGKTLQGTVSKNFITLRLDGKVVKTLPHGKYTVVVTDKSKTRNFQLVGPGVSKRTSVKGVGRSTWTLTLKKGKYVYSSSGRGKLKGHLQGR